jgi:hypothetical protein
MEAQRREVFVPLTYRPGDLAEVDFFEVLVDIDGDPPLSVAVSDVFAVLGARRCVDLRASDQISFDGQLRALPQTQDGRQACRRPTRTARKAP